MKYILDTNVLVAALLESDHFPGRVLTPRAALQRLDEGATG